MARWVQLVARLAGTVAGVGDGAASVWARTPRHRVDARRARWVSLQRIVFARWELDCVGKWGSHHQVMASDGALIGTIAGHVGDVYSVSFSSDGSVIASGSEDGTIKLWRVSDGELLHTLEGHTGGVASVSFSPDGRLLISGSYDSTIRIWRMADGTLLQTYDQETTGGVLSIQFSPNGQLFGYGCGDATLVMARNPFWRRNGDVNGDGCVDDSDLLAVLFAFGRSGSGLPEDLNGDGIVDDADLLEVLFNFGSGC
jgi:WD40 repeat protein